MISLTDQQLQDFQSLLDWKTGMELPDSRVLGDEGKRGKITQGTDSRVALVAERLQPADKTILEIGCCEGIHTVQLAQICKRVVALEVRPRNIVGTLIRLFVYGVNNVQVVMKDARELDASFGQFDIVFHVGVLYHLMNPVEHIFQIRNLGRDLLLDTHYCDDDTTFKRQTIKHAGNSYTAYIYKGERGWEDQFSGLEPRSLWLHRNSLLKVLRDAGYGTVEVVRDRVERNGPRITILARQPTPKPRTFFSRVALACQQGFRHLQRSAPDE